MTWLLALLGAVAPAGSVFAATKDVITNPPSPITIDIDEPTKPGGPRPLGAESEAAPPGDRGVLADTVWIADWTFDGASCNSTGWVKYDNRILNDGSNYWTIDTRFDSQGGIVNKAAILSKHDLCWARDGYGNQWDYSVILEYRGAGATLSLDFLSDSEPANDFVTIEADSAGVSEARVNYTLAPASGPAAYRSVLFATDGPNLSGTISGLALPDFGVPATTHEVYIRFASDGGGSDEDGYYRSALQAGLVVDNVTVTGTLNYSENFEGALNANVTFANTAPATPFGEWARLFSHITDNDKCSENTGCAWLLTDPTRIALHPDMAFGPGSAVVRNWLDDIFVSPWVSLVSTPSASGTNLSFRIFPGNRFPRSRIVQQWRVRSRVKIDNTDTVTPGDSFFCTSPWNSPTFSLLDGFDWETRVFDLSTVFNPRATEVQVSFRVSDWQLIAGDGPPAVPDPGPGPFIDRVRIGRRVTSGPALVPGPDSRTQAQDCFPTVLNGITPGEHFSPDGANRFGTCALSSAADLGVNSPGSPNLITGDSLSVLAADVRGAGGITSVKWYGAIVRGPHAGKAPAPYTVGGNGFFEVTADSARSASGVVIRDAYFVDLDDTYFRGGDALEYFWSAVDAGAGFASLPPGLSSLPASVAAAELATGGLYEVDFLPTINWDPAYLAAIAADAHGDLNPTPGQIAASTQKNCLLYVNDYVPARRSGASSRTTFMYSLDVLGYRGYYDVYDEQGTGNTNATLGGRANVPQASGYGLIIQDSGRNVSGTLPDGSSVDNGKVNQAQWYRSYLAQGLTGLAGTASLWIVGENVAQEHAPDPLLATDMGVTLVAADQGLGVNPDVKGVANFTWANGNSTTFVGDLFSLSGGCPVASNYDGLGAAGTGVITHRYAVGATTGSGAIVMNKNTLFHWNTVLSAFAWYEVAASGAPSSPRPEERLAGKILAQTLPISCQRAPNPTDVPDPDTNAVPAVTALHACVPNPFNPSTTIRFDLAQAGPTRLEIYDVAGHRVRVLVEGEQPAGWHRATWNGFDANGRRAASGIYLYRLSTRGAEFTRKMVLLK